MIRLDVDAVDHFAFEDLDAFEVKFMALCTHGVAFDDHKGAEYPVVEASVGVDPSGSPSYELVSPYSLGHRDAFMHLLREGDEIVLVDFKVGLLDILVLLIVGDDEVGVVHDFVWLAVGLGEFLVVNVQGLAFEKVVVELLLQLLVVL